MGRGRGRPRGCSWRGLTTGLRGRASSATFLLLPFRSAVLEPDLDLLLGEAEGCGDLRPLWETEVLLILEPVLQLLDLAGGVDCPRGPHFLPVSRCSLHPLLPVLGLSLGPRISSHEVKAILLMLETEQ